FAEKSSVEIAPKTQLSQIDFAQAQDKILISTEGPDLEMIRKNDKFGFSQDEIDRHFKHKIQLRYDFSGYDSSSIKSPPAVGVHPRVLFGPEELIHIRKNLKTTISGQKVMAAIIKEINNNIRKPGSSITQGYEALLKQDTETPIHKNISIAYSALYEAFRCLIEEDKAGGAEVAKAITTIAIIDKMEIKKQIAAYKKKNPDADLIDFRQTAKHPSQNGTLGLMYDWAYNWMNAKQRNTVREVISLASSNMTFIGCQTLRTPGSCRSNWIPWTSRLVTLLAAIEGEDGYDPKSYERCVSAMKWFFALSVFPKGESMEGWGKQFLMSELAYIMARRGEIFFALENVRNAFRSYWLHALNPWGRTGNECLYGGPFTFYDSQGGSNNNIPSITDLLVFKKLFPRDPHVNFIYRNAVGENYEAFDHRPNFRHHFATYSGFCKAIFAMTYDEDKSWKEELAHLSRDQGLTYYGNDTGTMITRSSWDPKALYLYSLTRNIMGGHRYADRGHFNLYAEGRFWGIYHKMRQIREAYLPMNRSTVLIDGEGVSIAPGKSVAFNDLSLGTFVASDLKISYDYISNYLFRANNEQRDVSTHLPYSYNHFRLNPSDRPTWNMVLRDRPDWLTSQKPGPPPKRYSATSGWRKQPVLMKKAFRTTGLVRGKNPYVLIVDDIKKDDKKRSYEWGMTLADDVELHSRAYAKSPKKFAADALLKEKGIKTEDSRFLLVRMVSARGLDPQSPAEIIEVRSKNPPQKDRIIPKLVFRAKTDEPKFICIITPVELLGERPVTRWLDDSTLELSWDNQVDQVRFRYTNKGRSLLSIERAGKVIASISE
ncbi:MAG: hypothetical protein HQL32_06725, partial [Planctomycetes bacterium]|nr:hypothetical protein [Planctomycetota bacterium]